MNNKHKHEILKKLTILRRRIEPNAYNINIDRAYLPVYEPDNCIDAGCIDYWSIRIGYDLYSKKEIEYILNKCNEIWTLILQKDTLVDAMTVPEINIKMHPTTIGSNPRKLKVKWTPEFDQDLNVWVREYTK